MTSCKVAKVTLPLILALALSVFSGVPVQKTQAKGTAGLSTINTLSLTRDMGINKPMLTTDITEGPPGTADDGTDAMAGGGGVHLGGAAVAADTGGAEGTAGAAVRADASTLAIKAVNPGYTIDDIKNSGEFIELVNLTSVNSAAGEENGEEGSAGKYHEMNILDLSGVAVIYTAKPSSSGSLGKSTILYQFPEGSRMMGESLVLKYREAPEVRAGDLTYDTSLAMTGSVSLVRLFDGLDTGSVSATSPLTDFGEVIQTLCWLGGEECLPVFSTTVKSRSFTTIVRGESGEYVHTNDYSPPEFDPESLYLPPKDDGGAGADASETGGASGAGETGGAGEASGADGASGASNLAPKCGGLEFSEIFSYYDADVSEQFVELFNAGGEPVELSGCTLRYKNKQYALATEPTVVQPSEYYVLRPEVRLTKNPNTENSLEIVDVNEAVVDTVTYPHGQKQGASYALIDYTLDGTENWRITYALTPGAANVFQEYRSCPEGKIINEATGNCVKAATMVSTTLKDCGAGKYRNPLTGRCKSYDSEDDEKTPCKEGYERNPETGRCRKVKSNDGADYPVVPLTSFEEKSTFVALLALCGVAAIGGGYVVFQFRKEIVYFVRKAVGKIMKK